MRRPLAPLVVALFLTVLTAACGGGSGSTNSRMASGDAGEPVLVSMGDSYIAGTAGRWRGNTNGYTNLPQDLASFSRTDTGANAYDNYGAQFPGEQCFRSRSAAIHLGGEWKSVNLACSNATTNSRTDETGRYKPGIDSAGQLAMLDDVARQDTVRLVAVSIGANDLRFGPVIMDCAQGFLTSLAVLPDRCSSDSAMRATISADAVSRARSAIARSLEGIVATMRSAGYADDAWSLISLTYPLPLPTAATMRYPQTGYDRQVIGGCPFYDADLDWFASWMRTLDGTVTAAAADASATSGKQIAVLDNADLFEGRRLCEQGTKLVEETTDDSGVRAYGERVDMVRLTSVLPGSPYDITEGVHPNQLGQLAIRACLRAAFNSGDSRSGTCRAPGNWSATNASGEPLVRFTPN